MNQIITRGIVLSRTDFGEADRILTFLTPDHGKLRLMAKGVRRIKSKLAGGIELFSVSDITFIHGKRDIGTLVSSRLQTHFGRIVQDLDRTMLGYELIKQLNKATEDNTEPAYYDLLLSAFLALDDASVDSGLLRVWFMAQLMQLSGHTPELGLDTDGRKLVAGTRYTFDLDSSALILHPDGPLDTSAIKFLRLLFSGSPLPTINRIGGADQLAEQLTPLLRTLWLTHIGR